MKDGRDCTEILCCDLVVIYFDWFIKKSFVASCNDV